MAAHSDDCVHLSVVFNIDMYEPKQSKQATTSINESNNAIFNVIGVVVGDMRQRTQTEKRCFLSIVTPLPKIVKQHVSVCVR